MKGIPCSSDDTEGGIPTLAPPRLYEFVPVKEPLFSKKTRTWSSARCRMNVIQYESLKPPAEINDCVYSSKSANVGDSLPNTGHIPIPSIPAQWRSLSASEKANSSDPVMVAKWRWSAKSNSKRLKISNNAQKDLLPVKTLV